MPPILTGYAVGPEETPGASDPALSVESLANATALVGLLADARWANFVEPALHQVQARAAKRASVVPLTLDGAVQAAYLHGQQEGIDEFRRTLSRLRRLADRIIAEARITRPV